jgi:hypothetical protein
MLTALIPDEARIPDLELSPDTLGLRDELAGRLRSADVPPLEMAVFVHRLLTTFCQDGSSLGLALFPPVTHPPRRPGQMCRIPDTAWQPRAAIGEPLLCALARRIARAAAEAQPEHAAWLPIASHLLDQVGAVLNDLSKEGHRALTLLVRPGGTANRIFDLHFHTAGYPAWDHLAFRLQAGLVAQIRKESDPAFNKPKSVRDHNIRTYCTAPKTLVPLIHTELLAPALAALDEDASLLRDALWQAAALVESITPNTRHDYVTKLLDLLRRGAASRSPSIGQSGFGRRRRRPFRLAELDPEAHPAGVPGNRDWQELARRAALDEDAPVVESDPDEEEREYDGDPAGVEIAEQSRSSSSSSNRRHLWYLGNRITMERNRGPDDPCVFQVREVAEFYAAMLSGPVRRRDLAERLNRASRFLMLDLMFHTGRPAEWLAAIALGQLPSPDEALSQPVYDAGRGAIGYAPACHVGVPPRLLGSDEEAASERRRQAESCEPVRLWYPLPLAPFQASLISAYLKLRAQAAATMRPIEGAYMPDDAGPLLLLARDGRLRPWVEADTGILHQDLTAALRRHHPSWPAVRPARFRLSFSAWYRHYGLDPLYGFYVSEHYHNEFQMPAIYSRVRVEALARAYATVQERLRADIEAEYRNLIGTAADSKNDPLLWRPEAAPETVPWRNEDAFGSWHCPRRSRVRALLAGLADMAASADPATARRGRIGRTAAGLTALSGLRPAEVCNLRARWVDLDDGSIAVDGKDNFALTADRQVPVAGALRPLLEEALGESVHGPLADDGRGHYLLWLDAGGGPVTLSEEDGNRILVEAGARAGLREEQVPDWYALRHSYRSHALEAGAPFEVINALMGHQVLGCDLYNRALDQQVEGVLAQGRTLADHIVQEIGWNDNGTD